MFDINQAVSLHADATVLRAHRAEILATNLANADTPNYKARDLDFSALLDHEMDAASLTRSSADPLGAEEIGNTDYESMYRIPTQASLDQNTVDVQAERAAFLDNAMRYQAGLRFLGDQFSGLISAFKGE